MGVKNIHTILENFNSHHFEIRFDEDMRCEMQYRFMDSYITGKILNCIIPKNKTASKVCHKLFLIFCY